RGDGNRIRVALSLSHAGTGAARSTIAILRDITPELELKERVALHVLIADGTNRSVIIVDRKMRIVYANATFEGMFGYTIWLARGRRADELLAGRHTDRRALKRLQRCIADDAGHDEDLLAYDRNGDEVWLSARVKAFRNARGRVKYIVALMSDITETKQLWSL